MKSRRATRTAATGAYRELVYPYVQKALQEDETPTAANFIKFYKENKETFSPNYIHLFNMVTRYGQGIINFRKGVRNNNPQYIDSGLMHTKELFYGRYHPHYQKLFLDVVLQKWMMPKEVRTLCEKYSSFSSNTHRAVGEGLDYKIEEENK